MRDFRYLVSVRTGVSIGPREYTQIVALTSPDPALAIVRALRAIKRRDPDNQLWQSDEVHVSVERTA